MRRFGYLFLCAILVVSIPLTSLASDNTVKVGIYQNKPKVFSNYFTMIERLA